MTDTPKNPQLNEEQVDQLLTAFYKSEVPDQLNVPPSQWSQLQGSSSPVVAPASTPSTNTQPSARRGVVVAVASLAACLTLLAISDFGPSPSDNPAGNSVAVETDEPTVTPDPDALMNVSENPDQGKDDTLNENGLKMEELEDIQLDETPADKSDKAKDDE